MSWELHTDRGRQTWHYNHSNPQPEIPYDKSINPNSSDLIYRRQARKNFKPINQSTIDSIRQSINQSTPLDEFTNQSINADLKAVNFYESLQMIDGHWPGDYGGPMFLLPGVVITQYIIDRLIDWSSEKKKEMIKYLFNHQRADGGWGLHIEAESTQFGTVMNYVTLRLLGIDRSDDRLVDTLKFIQKNGGAVTAPSWAKFWLATLNVFDWKGMNTIFPELWLLPEAAPLHPWRWWCHCRMVYLPMAYIYAKKFSAPVDPLISQLREELYCEPYASIDWPSHRDHIAPIDLYTPQTPVLKVVNFIGNLYERFHSRFLRDRAADFMLSYIEAEDAQTKHIDIGPVNKFINMLSIFVAYGKDDERFKAHQRTVDDYLWVAEDGMKCQGYNGSQLWDTAFASQALVESGFAKQFSKTIQYAHNYVDISQVQEDVPERITYYRHISKGGWPFSTLDHGWPITDCTAEGMKATFALQSTGLIAADKVLNDQRLHDAANVLLTFQNESGGWATYENQRAGGWMEWINPAEVFSGIMVDYPYVECSSASVQALSAYQRHYPTNPRFLEISEAIARGVSFIKSVQREDGSWYGSWAVCFTYGTWFGVEGLIAAGEPRDSHVLKKACRWLVGAQKEDGGWGESYLSCVKKVYVEHEKSQIINTAWACLSLMAADQQGEYDQQIERGIRLILSRQMADGDFPQEGISGVFNGNCMITYTNYRNIFPIWAIGRFIQRKRRQAAAIQH